MFKKIISGAFAATLVFAVPTMALACNWGAQASGDCEKLEVAVKVEQGKSEKAGYYDLYWSKDGNPKKGTKIATGEIPALKKGEVHNVSYDVAKNGNGKEGRYIFHLVEPKGSIWSKEIVVNNCTETPPPTTDNGGTTTPPTTDNGGTTTPPTTDNGGTTTPPTTDNGGTTTPPTTDNGGTTTPPAANGGPTTLPATDNGGKNPAQTKPNGGTMPKTASTYPTVIALGAVLIAGGALTLRVQKQN